LRLNTSALRSSVLSPKPTRQWSQPASSTVKLSAGVAHGATMTSCLIGCVTQRNQYLLELDRALSKRDLAQANVARAQIEQKDTEIELADQTLARTQIRAPFASSLSSET
jgi:multidrug resistance efflux pump